MNVRLQFREANTGSSLIEFALTVSILLMMIFGIMDFSRAIYVNHFLANTAREATRYAMVRGSSWRGAVCSTVTSFGCTASATNVAAYVSVLAPNGVDPASIVTTTTWPGTDVNGAGCAVAGALNSPGCTVRVRLTYSFAFALPFLPKNALLLSSTSQVTIAQ